MRVFVRTARRFRSRSAGSGFCSCSHVVPHGPGARRPDRPSSVSERLQERKWIVQFPGPKDYSCEMRFTATERIVTLVYMGRHESRSDYRLFDEPACRFRPGGDGRERKRTLHRDADPRPRRSGRTVSRRIPNFRHLGTVRFPADSAGYENPCRDRLPGRTGVLSKGCDRSRHGCEQANPITEPVPSATDHA